eukprot:m51a1_g10521 hypothetical protein (137) ;mRNA; r:218854-219463
MTDSNVYEEALTCVLAPDNACVIRGVASLRQLLESEPGNADYLWALSTGLLRLGRPREASVYAHTLLLLSPADARLRSLVALVDDSRGRVARLGGLVLFGGLGAVAGVAVTARWWVPLARSACAAVARVFWGRRSR